MSIATLAQQQQSVEITSEPSHHLVMENEYVRVFDVTVAPKASTLVHRHNKDYVFVTLGDSDVVSARPGEKPVPLVLKDGEIRFTAGKFAHAAINQSEKPFHNITIELLKPATNVKSCVQCSMADRQITSDQWTMSVFSVQPGHDVRVAEHISDALFIAVSELGVARQPNGESVTTLTPGKFEWLPAGTVRYVKNTGASPVMYVLLKFNSEKR